MVLLVDAIEQKKFDQRLVDKQLRDGTLTQKELDQFLNSLPDDGANAEWVNVENLDDDDSSK